MDITNSQWEGEIKGQGSSVLIRNRPTVDVTDYTVNQDIQYQDILDEMITLNINQAKSFSFKIDDIDATQSNIPIMNELTQDAAFQMKIAIDKIVLGSIYSDATNVLPTLTMDKTNVVDWLIDMAVKMEENNLPEENRWVVLPPKAGGYLQKSDLKNAAITGDAKSVMRSGMNNGRLGEIAGLTVYISNNLTRSGTTYQCIAGQKSAVTFASQIVKVESLRLQTKFGDAVRGLNCFGFKTLIPGGLVSAPAIIS